MPGGTPAKTLMGVLASRRSTRRRLPRFPPPSSRRRRPPPTCRPDAPGESARPPHCARRSREKLLLANRSVWRHRESETRLVAVAGRSRVLDQRNVNHLNVSLHLSRRILVARVLVIYSERHPHVDRHIREPDLVPIWLNGLQRDGGEVTPARMDVSRAHGIGARLCRRRKIGSSRRRGCQHDADRAGLRRGRRGPVRLIATRWCEDQGGGHNQTPPVHRRSILRTRRAATQPINNQRSFPRPATAPAGISLNSWHSIVIESFSQLRFSRRDARGRRSRHAGRPARSWISRTITAIRQSSGQPPNRSGSRRSPTA